MVAKVYVNIGELSIDAEYEYFVPETMAARVVRGQRVVVPFGKGNKKIEGVVVCVAKEQTRYDIKLKAIAYLLDEDIVSEYSLSFAEFIKERCFCTFFDALRLILPPGGYRRFFEKIYVNLEADLTKCDDEELEIYNYVKGKDGVTLSNLEASYKNVKKSK